MLHYVTRRYAASAPRGSAPAATPSTLTGPAPCADVAQPVAHRLRRDLRARRAPLPAAEAEREVRRQRLECVQPEPCAAPSGWRSPASCDAARRRRRRPIASSRWPPVTTTTSGPCSARARASARPRGPRERLRTSSPGAGQHARLGQVRRDHGRQRQQPLTIAAARLVVEQHGPALGDHHRVDHDWHAVERCTSASPPPRRSPPVAQHADLDRVDADVLGHGPHLLDDELAGHRVDAGHAHRVLRGERRDRGHPVHAAAGERLQVGLDAGAAARVRAGDRGGVGVGGWGPVGGGGGKRGVLGSKGSKGVPRTSGPASGRLRATRALAVVNALSAALRGDRVVALGGGEDVAQPGLVRTLPIAARGCPHEPGTVRMPRRTARRARRRGA